MLIKSLQVRNFRNLHQLDTTFEPGLNVIYGRNAQGKTNLLEAIYLLVTGRSFRTTNDSELIPWNLDEYTGTTVRAVIQKAAGEEQLGFYFDGKIKRVIVDGTPITRLANLVGRLNAVLFTPTDLLIVRGAPGLRRRFLDIAIGQTNRIYMDALQQYQQVLRNRNILLKQAAGRAVAASNMLHLDVYDQQLAESGAKIIQLRAQALVEISHSAAQNYRAIAGVDEELQLAYEPDIQLLPDSVDAPAVEAMLEQFRKNRSDDLRRLSTTHGPHRDDFSFQINSFSARQFASQGQQRSAVLALKFAEMDYLYAHTSERPLLMLDDVISELDEERKSAFLSHLDPATQTFITTTDPQTITAHAAAQRLLKMGSGKLTSM